MKELVRCKACGYVMQADKLKDVCPACGMSYKVFEPYRERVALNRLFVLNLDLHPITIHLSQSLVILIPALIIFTNLFPSFHSRLLADVLRFSVYAFPLTLISALLTGLLDGLYRFKSLRPPFLQLKIIFGSSIIVLSVIMFFVKNAGNNGILPLALSLGCLYFAFRLGLLGKKLMNVILPGSYPVKKPKIVPKSGQENTTMN